MGNLEVSTLSSPSGNKLVLKCLVGSRLHGLYNEASDYDYRGIHMYPLKDFLSPFKTLKNTSWLEGDVDETSYELADFCKAATKGNATILEVFFSNKIEQTSDIADTMRDNWQKFMDTDQFVMASRGYAANQLNKMALFDDIGVKGQRRTPKFVVAYCRVLWQCAEFLKDGIFKCEITDPEMKAYLMNIKYNWSEELIPSVTQKFTEIQAEVSLAWAKAPKIKPDIPWIEDFIYQSYMQTELNGSEKSAEEPIYNHMRDLPTCMLAHCKCMNPSCTNHHYAQDEER